MAGVVLLRIDGVLKGVCLSVQEKGLTPHQAENGTQYEKADDKIAGEFHQPGSRPCKALVHELLNEFHSYHLEPMITYLFAVVNNKLMFIVKLLI